ncbi:MAG: alanine--glyoxylate aminotransferase family protein [Helicobacter sp.]|nr:alanine--glyoxylate aminotransferase family protein [Helicobacter sp.]MDY5740072.1 alanine--glyoxylate aminotransferase family protein [Helicobacter sp.]
MLLFTPGPTPIPESIRVAMSVPTLHHRTPEFEAIFARVREELKALLKMPEVLMLASSGSGAMEACVRTFTRKKMLSVNCGKFGERFGKIAQSYNIPYVEIKHQWDTPASEQEILQAFQNDSELDCLCVQMCESAGGLRHPVEEIAKALKSYNPEIMVVVDSITAMGVEPIDTTHIDALIGGSQKAFMLPPGLSIIGLSDSALKVLESHSTGFYFNLKTELKNQIKNTTAWTAPTTIIQGLDKYFSLVKEYGGIGTIYKLTLARALATNEALSALGLKIYPKSPALAMSAIYDEKHAKDLRKILKNDFGINAAGGQDHLKDSLVRFNHMGLIPLHESAWVLNGVELALQKLGIRKFDGLGNNVFIKKYYELLG